MNDTLITARRKKTELVTWAVCFLAANLVNLYAILTYPRTSWAELITSLGYVTAASVAIYVAWTVVRLLFYGLRNACKRKKRDGKAAGDTTSL